MKNKRLHKGILNIALALLLLIVSFISGGLMVPAFADTSEYSEVLDDLNKDGNFNVSDYPIISGDYSLKVIQIAEGINDELFIYVYQPCGQTKRFVATSVNISPIVSDGKQYENFELQLINSSGTLYKYKVLNYYSVKDKSIRYYEISSIYRKWEKAVDGEPENGDVVSEKAYAVGQCWVAVTVDDKVVYSCEEVEFLDVTKQFVHFLRYDDGFQWGGIKNCDAHFFAFNCDHNINRLLSADLLFYTQEYKRMEGQDYKLLDTKTKHYVTVDYTMEGASNKEKWQRMSSTSEFLAEHKDSVPSDEADKISQYDWIINFYETEYERDFGGKDILITLLVPGGFIWSTVNACTTYGTIVSDVTLLRLEFEYAGKIYNLGVVSDKQTGDPEPPISNEPTNNNSGGFWQFLWNCLAKTFTGKGSWWQIAITVALLVVAFLAGCVVVRLIRFAIDSFKRKK